MKSPKRTLWIVGVLVSLVLSVAAWVDTAPRRGRLRARFDVWRGHYIVLAYGLPSPWRREYGQLPRERYAIEIHTVALCIVSETLCSYADSYNAVSAAAANRKFGHDVFKECAGVASKNWDQTQKSLLGLELVIR
jgi:hypothetical protein